MISHVREFDIINNHVGLLNPKAALIVIVISCQIISIWIGMNELIKITDRDIINHRVANFQMIIRSQRKNVKRFCGYLWPNF